MKRLDGWRTRLIETIEAWQSRALDEPDTNCGVFAADCVAAMTGFDFAAGLRGRGLGIVEGTLALREAGYRDAVAFAAKHLAEVPASHAQVGDVVALAVEAPLTQTLSPQGGEGGGQSPALGICNGATIAVLRPQGGIGFVPLQDAVRAFRI